MKVGLKKNIFITGSEGFIGSHLVEQLVKSGFNVKALVQYNSFSSYGWLDSSEFLGDIEVQLGDIRDLPNMQSLIKGSDIVVHLASLIAIPYSYKASKSYIDTNVNGTLNIMQSSMESSVEKIIHISTSEVYGSAKYVPIDESHPLQAQSPYSASKIGADAIAFSFHKSYNLPLIIARPFNTFGPRQSSRAVIPTIISQLLRGDNNINLGSLTPIRDFNYVLDTCNGIISLINSDSEAIGETFNIGSGTGVNIEKLVYLIGDLIGITPKISCDKKRIRPKDSEVDRLICNNEKIKKMAGFSPKYTLEEGLSKTIKWMKNPKNLEKYKADIYNV